MVKVAADFAVLSDETKGGTKLDKSDNCEFGEARKKIQLEIRNFDGR